MIERCVQRAREEYANDPANLVDNITRQDSIILNIQRACEASIDLAMHFVRVQRLGLPQDSRDAFELLRESGWLEEDLTDALKRRVGFRNVAVQDYEALNLDVVRAILTSHLDELLRFARLAIERSGSRPKARAYPGFPAISTNRSALAARASRSRKRSGSGSRSQSVRVFENVSPAVQ